MGWARCTYDQHGTPQVGDIFPDLKHRQAPGGQRKRFRDTLKASLVKCDIPTDTWQSLAQDDLKWRRSIREGVKHLETCLWEEAEA
eukprot:g17901.t1